MNPISYKLRIDMDTIQPILSTVLHDIREYSYCQEVGPNGQNPHIHIYLRTHLKSDTLRKRVKKLSDYFPGNGFYSLAPLIPDPDHCHEFPYVAYHAYMLKQADVFYSEYMLQKHLNTAHKFILKDTALEHLAMQKKNKITKKKKGKTILQQMQEDIKNSKSVIISDANSVVQFVVQWYKSHDKLPREFLMVAQVQYLLLQNDPSYGSVLAGNIIKSTHKSWS